MKKYKVTCRKGITYDVHLRGTQGEIARTLDMLQKCCCWVCYNRDCKTPEEVKIPNCGNVCELFTNNPYCERKETEK